MKKLFVITILTLCLSLAADAQTVSPDPDINRVQLISALERAQSEVRASRKYVDALKQELAAKEAIIKRQSELAILSAEAVKSLQSETINLRAAIEAQERIIKTSEIEISELKKQRDATRKKLSRARAVTRYLLAAAAALGALAVIK